MRLFSILAPKAPLFIPALAAAALFTLAPTSHAGYIVTTGTDAVLTPQGPTPGAQIGDTFSTSTPAGTLTNYIPDTPLDPQLTGADLNHYGYTLNGAVSNITGPLNNIITYTGTYSIFYDVNLDGTPDATVSSGNFDITATFNGSPTASLTGSLNQTAGPSNPAFADLSYGGNPVLYAGTYTETDPGVSGTIQGTLTQSAVALPEPASLSLLALTALPLLSRRRKA